MGVRAEECGLERGRAPCLALLRPAGVGGEMGLEEPAAGVGCQTTEAVRIVLEETSRLEKMLILKTKI